MTSCSERSNYVHKGGIWSGVRDRLALSWFQSGHGRQLSLDPRSVDPGLLVSHVISPQ